MRAFAATRGRLSSLYRTMCGRWHRVGAGEQWPLLCAVLCFGNVRCTGTRIRVLRMTVIASVLFVAMCKPYYCYYAPLLWGCSLCGNPPPLVFRSGLCEELISHC